MGPGVLLWIVASSLGRAGIAAQTPPDTVPRPDTPAVDTLPRDTADVPGADTLAPPDTLPPDTAASDTVRASIDTLPALPPTVPAEFATGSWEWSREEIMANRALTLAELLEQIPGVVALRGGHYGMPRSVSALGVAGGGVRVFRDGVEHVPLSGSVPDLARIGLGGIESVRVERGGGGLRVEMETHRPDDPRPYSLVEAGTGDLDTNLLRGAFLHPSALGGNVGVALDRIETQGRDFRQPGSISSVWLRYTFVGGDRFGIAAELDRATQDRDTLYVPSRVTRTDWSVRARARLADGLVADVFWARADVEADTADAPDPTEAGFPFRADVRSQLGARISAARGPLFGRFAFRSFDGAGLPSSSLEAELGARGTAWGGVVGTLRRDAWDPEAATTLGVRAWTRPYRGLSAFASWEEFERGVPFLPALPPDDAEDGATGDGAAPPPGQSEPAFTTGSTGRLGIRFHWRGLDVSTAVLRTEADSLHPLGLPMDRGGPPFPGDERRGWETAFRVPLLLLDGLDLTGSAQVWEVQETPWPYFPQRTWDTALSFHDTFFPTGNLELWVDLGFRGRDPMNVVPVPPGADGGPTDGAPPPSVIVPSYRNWYARLQVRVVTVRIFVNLENFMRRLENQDFPDRLLPLNRTVFGVRWTLWN